VEEGRSLKTQEDISDYVQRFYQTLYTLDPMVEDNQGAKEACFLSVPTVVTMEQNKSLIEDITREEVLEATKCLPIHKAAGHDSIPTEWFQTS